MNLLLDSSIHNVKGIGDKTEKLFNKIGVYTLGDILLFFPRDYKNYTLPEEISNLESGNYQAVLGMVNRPISVRYFKNISIQTARCDTEEGQIEIIWYRMPYIRNNITLGIPYVFYGRVSEKDQKIRIEQPSVFVPEEYYNIVKRPNPVYSTTKGLSKKIIEKAVKEALGLFKPEEELLPDNIVKKNQLINYHDAVKYMHFPESVEQLILARNRFVYEELLQFFLESKSEELSRDIINNNFNINKLEYTDAVIEGLPYSLTNGQKSAFESISNDFVGENITERLIQGDVGCGKTIIAFLSMLMVAENGYQSSLMAPTEVLARQHYYYFLEMISKFNLPFSVVLIVGSMKKSEKKIAYEQVKDGDVSFVIGTHALIQEGLIYNSLGLTVTDEQHRFGVKQRKILSEKGGTPFSLLLSATPIPRTLALILYNGMNVSVIKELPKERLKIKTAVIDSNMRNKAWKMAVSEIKKGRQVYIVCPLVEASDNIDGENVHDYRDMLQVALGNGVDIEIIHGKLKPAEKDLIMQNFKDGKIDVLVSTTVIEVGVNVSNASVMIIENADRFGLASLHQLRGRVGRGKYQSYCILVNSSSKNNQKASDRLNVLHESNDGFVIAEKDLTLRGPGDFEGIRQSGDSSFTIADIYQDAALLEAASTDAENIIKSDPELTDPENKYLKLLRDKELEKLYTNL